MERKDNARDQTASRDYDGFAAQLRIILLLHWSINRVHVDVHDFAYLHDENILFLSFELRASANKITEGTMS